MLHEILRAWVGLRARWRGLALPFFALPLLPAALLFAIGGNSRAVAGCLLGIGATVLAMKVLRRGRRGDIRRAGWLMGIGTFLVALMAAKLAMPMPFAMAALALFGTRLMYAELPEAAPPAPPAPPPPPPGPVEQARLRLETLRGSARWLGNAQLGGTVEAMQRVVDDLAQRPERLDMARRFLTVHLDGLERIAERLQAGAQPPATLAPLLDELTQTADTLRETIRREETAALEIQVKVLSDRLKQEGFA